MPTPFTTFLHQTRPDDIPAQVIDLARLWLLDLLGVAAGGVGTNLSTIIRDHAVDQFGAGSRGARMLFDSRTVSPVGAALAGGMSIDALDAHDGHKITKGHVGCGVLPALLALADAEGLNDDREFLTALIIGYEIVTRAGIALHQTACDYHTSGAWVSIATAALGARALQLTSSKTAHAIGIAEYHGPRSQMMRVIDHPTMLKDGSGWGSMAGVSAAYLAAKGFTEAPAITVVGDDVADLWSDLGQNWRINEQYFKAFPVCRWAQPPVQAVLDLRKAHDLSSHDVAQIEIATFHQSKRLATRAPTTTEEAQYSTAFPTAVALVKGAISPADVSAERFVDPEVQRLAKSMIITEDDGFNDAFPQRRIARVKLKLTDGRELVSDDTEAVGDPENPVSAEVFSKKFFGYAQPSLGSDRAHAIEDAVRALGDGSGCIRLFDLIFAPV